jgi:hypothetical protein
MALSIGILRKRLPVAAKIALATAGTMADVRASPIVPAARKIAISSSSASTQL